MAKAKIKTLLGTGLAALCSHIKQCNTALGDLSEATANGFEETDDILHEKQDVTAAVSFTIPVDGWGEDDSSPGYFYCDIPIAGLLATDIVDVTVLPEFYDVAGAVGFIATESLEGKLRLRAAKAPTEKISAQYLHGGRPCGHGAGGGTSGLRPCGRKDCVQVDRQRRGKVR